MASRSLSCAAPIRQYSALQAWLLEKMFRLNTIRPARETPSHMRIADAAGGTYSQLYVVRCLSCRFRILPFPLLSGGTNPAHGCCWTRVKVLLASTISGVDALHTSIPISSHPTFHQVAVSGGCVPPNNSPRNLVVETSHFLDCENCLHCSTPCVVLILPKPQL